MVRKSSEKAGIQLNLEWQAVERSRHKGLQDQNLQCYKYQEVFQLLIRLLPAGHAEPLAGPSCITILIWSCPLSSMGFPVPYKADSEIGSGHRKICGKCPWEHTVRCKSEQQTQELLDPRASHKGWAQPQGLWKSVSSLNNTNFASSDANCLFTAYQKLVSTFDLISHF